MAYPISDVTRRIIYSGSAGTGPYSFAFEILDQTDIAVYKNTTLLTLTTDYSVSINVDGTGSITLVTPAVAADDITLIGARAIERTTDFVTGGDLFANSLNDELDAQTIFAQQQQDEINRSMKMAPWTNTAFDTQLPDPLPNHFLAFNATADGFQSLAGAELAGLIAYATPYADTFTGDGSRVSWTLTRPPINLLALDVSIDGVTQVPTTNYTVSGTTFTMTSAPPVNSVILVRYAEYLPPSTGDSLGIRYVPAGTGAVDTNVQTKLRETVSVKDFGAVGNGIADDTAAINSAFNSGAKVIYATGTYLISSNVTLPSGVSFVGWHRATIVSDGGGNFIVTSDSTVENIDFDWNSTARRVYGDNANSITFRNCTSYNSTGNGFDLFNGPVDLTFEGCMAYDNGGFGIAALGSTTQRPNRITVRNCKAYRNYYDGIVVAGVGEKTSPAQTALYARNIVISDCIANGNGTGSSFNGITTPYCQYVTIANCITYDNDEHGVALQETFDFSISNVVSYGNGQAGLSMQSGYDPFNPTTRGVVTGFNAYNNANEGLALKEKCENIIFSGCSFSSNVQYSVRLRDIGSSGLISTAITFIGCSIEPSPGAGFVNSNGSVAVTSSSAYNFTGTTLQPNAMLTDTTSTSVTLDTIGTGINYPELFILTDSGADVSRTSIAQATTGRRITLMADGSGAVAIRHNQGDGATYAGFILQAAATVTLGAYESITFVSNGTNWIQVAANI